MRSVVVALMLSVAACNATLDDPGLEPRPDAPGGGSGMVDAAPDSPTVATCGNGRVVYLNFDGVTLTQGVSDATLNRASWLQQATGTAPAYRVGVATRLADISTITDGVRQRLASFPISVVTTRPQAGPYVMIVYGGTAAQVTSRFGGAVNQLDCGDVQRNDLAWIGDGVAPNLAVNYSIGAIGFGLGLTATLATNDCMCGWDNACVPDGTACVLTDNIARDPAANQLCAGLTTQSETQAFTAAFCQ